MICPKCGSEVSDGSAFCTKCGASLAGAAQNNAGATQNNAAQNNAGYEQPGYQQPNGNASVSDGNCRNHYCTACIQRVTIYIFSCASGFEDYSGYYDSWNHSRSAVLYPYNSDCGSSLCNYSVGCPDYLLFPDLLRKGKGSADCQQLWIFKVGLNYISCKRRHSHFWLCLF